MEFKVTTVQANTIDLIEKYSNYAIVKGNEAKVVSEGYILYFLPITEVQTAFLKRNLTGWEQVY
jgi:hypothetical protein